MIISPMYLEVSFYPFNLDLRGASLLTVIECEEGFIGLRILWVHTLACVENLRLLIEDEVHILSLNEGTYGPLTSSLLSY